jgi:bifunctional UDP-N-acetylglucosamine pyrophosphorylase/glucosamine-1-phosphate N-acetyltransferase
VNIAVIVLAAGLGTRMKSAIPKVLHPLLGKPLIKHVIDTITPLKPAQTIVVVNPHGKPIREVLAGLDLIFAVQKNMKGTGDAVRTAIRHLDLKKSDTILVVNGDTPLLKTESLKQFLSLHKARREAVSILSFHEVPPHEYGRIIRDKGQVVGIVENRDATDEQRLISEVNSGVYAINSEALTLLKQLKINKAKGEYYLTDIVEIAVRKGLKVGAHMIGTAQEYTGINTREDLYRAGLFLRRSIASFWMSHGVTILDRDSVFIDSTVKIGSDTVIYPHVHIEGNTIIGSQCTIYPNARITNCILGDHVTIKDSTVMEDSTILDAAMIGPFAHIRPASVIGRLAKIGNFVEVKKSVIGDGTKASHLSYIGDAEVGNKVNIGAGFITCNYDGKNKHKTIIGDNVFIGSDTQIVAPVTVGNSAYIGAGSTITKDVPSRALSLSRTEQVNIDKWVDRHTSPKAAQRPPKKKGDPYKRQA